MVEQAPASPSTERGIIRKTRVGTVVSDKNDKTIVVAVGRTSRHRLYRKVIRRTKNYHAHDETNEATVGDLVRIEECRPFSRLKRWRLVEVLTEREVAEVAPEELDEELVDEMQRSAARAAAEEAEVAEGEQAATEEAGPAAEGAEAPAAAATEEVAPAAEEEAAPAAETAGETEPEDTRPAGSTDEEPDEEKAP